MGHYYMLLLAGESPPPPTGIYVTGGFPFPDLEREGHICSMCLCVDFSRGFLDLNFYSSGVASMQLSANQDEVPTGWGMLLMGYSIAILTIQLRKTFFDFWRQEDTSLWWIRTQVLRAFFVISGWCVPILWSLEIRIRGGLMMLWKRFCSIKLRWKLSQVMILRGFELCMKRCDDSVRYLGV